MLHSIRNVKLVKCDFSQCLLLLFVSCFLSSYDGLKPRVYIIDREFTFDVRLTTPSKWVILHQGLPGPSPTQHCNFSNKRFTPIYEKMYKNLYRSGKLKQLFDQRENHLCYHMTFIEKCKSIANGRKLSRIANVAKTLRYSSTTIS